ncbi:TetR/AcrR family transcriptional regulator [Rhodococcus sp. NPDC058532]|uniref:TetR/AcrR family transcriptional regulator n=1 Tax=Rhodococcus sp. NPDC058532 TaxID=3346540 RepID=UPI0036472688
MQTAGDDLPRTVRRAWGFVEAGSRGPRRGLTLEQILDAAIELADAEGVAAVSMARLAKQLGFTPMSLYRYVDSKDELVELITDRALGAPPALDPDLPWRAGLHAWALAEYARVLRHPWWLQLPIVAPPTGPNNLRWLDAGLGTLAAVPVSEMVKVQVVTTTSLFVVGRARLSSDMASAATDEIDYGALLPKLVDTARFPHLVAALVGGGFDEDDGGGAHPGELGFRFALDLLLDGVQTLIDARS